MVKRTKAKPQEREKIPIKTRNLLLTECGYRCACPTCRTILALDLHHIDAVSDGGGNDPSNLIALCPTCHALHHRGIIKKESIYVWKAMLVAITGAFDLEAIDRLLFLEPLKKNHLIVSGDGLLSFSRLIAAGLAEFTQKSNNNFQIVTYAINISNKGRLLIEAWKQGNRSQLQKAMSVPVPVE